jgi:hypothetical protein
MIAIPFDNNNSIYFLDMNASQTLFAIIKRFSYGIPKELFK